MSPPKGAADYIEFLKRAFNAAEIARAPGRDGKLKHAAVQIGDPSIMFERAFPRIRSPADSGRRLALRIASVRADADALFTQATAAGCEVTMPLADQFWGDRLRRAARSVRLPLEHRTRKEILTPQEMSERQKAAFGRRVIV